MLLLLLHLLIELSTICFVVDCCLSLLYHSLFLFYIGMLSGLVSQPSQVWLMPTPMLSHQDSPATGTKCTTTCQS